jgi:hypothetical protein
MTYGTSGRASFLFGLFVSCFLFVHAAPPAAAFPDAPQIRNAQPGRHRGGAQRGPARELFEEIERGLASGNANSLSGLLAPEVQVSLRGGESGYFSSHQAYYLLETYLRNRRLVNLTFSTIGDADNYPYATGGANLLYRGSREYVQVYVALSPAGDRWVISRINIY